MSLPRSKFSWGLLTVCVTAGLLTIATGQTPQTKPAAELLSAETVIYYTADGSANHKAAWEKTAAYKSMYQSGMMKPIDKLIEFVTTQGGRQPRPQEVDAAIGLVEANGLSASVVLPQEGPPLPRVTIVLHKAAALYDSLVKIAKDQGREMEMEFEKRDVKGRSVMAGVVPHSPGVEIGFWTEGEHLVVAGGIGAVAAAIAVANGDVPNVKENPNWKKYQLSSARSEAVSVTWIDFQTIKNKFGTFPLPQPFNGSANDALQALGLHNLGTLAWQYGYKGQALWSDGHVEVNGPKTGLLSLLDQDSFTLKDLPPLPKEASGFYATKFDNSKAWDTIVQVARDVAKLGPPDAVQQIDDGLEALPQILGFDPKTDLMDALGDMLCIYTDPDQGFMGTSSGIACKVKDSKKLRATLEKIYAIAGEASRGEFAVETTEKNGQKVDMFNFDGRIKIGAITVGPEWMVVSLMPQTLDAFSLRRDGKLPTWTPNEKMSDALSEMPKEFHSISVGDPRIAWQSIVKLAPALLLSAETAMREQRMIPRGENLPVSAFDIPPAELVAHPLFPNISVTQVDDNGMRLTTRQSLPGIPLVGGVGEGSSAATAAVAVALLLPAVQQAREAARRTQSKNNLKQVGLALHNYHDVYNHFPSGTHPNEKLKPEKRFGWLASILPFIEQYALHDRLDFDLAWDDEENEKWVKSNIMVFIHPSYGPDPTGKAVSHYVGMAGVGKDAPELAKNHKRAGIFGHDRKTRIRDITDGTSNTIIVTEASKDFGNWAQGGKAAYRSLTKKPYINGPDGIGGPSIGGCNIGLADGSVRFVSENIDPKVMEALSTMAGGEVIGQF